MKDRVLDFLILFGVFSFLPILGLTFANLQWHLAFLPFALVVFSYPAGLFLVIETIGEWHPVSVLLKFILLLHFLNLYYQQIDWLLDFDGSLLGIAGQILGFVFMAPMITCFEYGAAIADFVKIADMTQNISGNSTFSKYFVAILESPVDPKNPDVT